jgi:hypothetical protein
MATEDKKEYRHRHHGKHFPIPAGVLIGLGVGLLAGYPAAGGLIGLGLGFLGSAFVNPVQPAGGDAAVPAPAGRPRWVFALIGIFLIIIGIGILRAPVNIWPYIVAAFLILLGIWFLVRGFVNPS